MELHEFHVRDPAAGAPAHGDAVAGGDVGIAGVDVDLAGAAAGDDHEAGLEGLDLIAAMIEQIGTEHAVARAAELAFGDQIDRRVVFEQRDVGALRAPGRRAWSRRRGRWHRRRGSRGDGYGHPRASDDSRWNWRR